MAKGEIFKGLPKWAQGAIAVSIVAGAFVIAYRVYRKMQEDKMLEGAKAEGDSINSELKQLQQAGKGQSLSQSQVTEVANQLFTAMDGAATDVKSIYAAVAKIRNQADLLAVKKAYGIRELSSGKLNPVPNFKGTLSQSLVDELDHLQLAAVNSMLAKKGITQRF